MPIHVRSLALTVIAAVMAITAKTAAQCEHALAGAAVDGASRYECYAASIARCSTCAIYFDYEVERRLVAESRSPSFVIRSSPAFSGVFVLVARSESGAVLSEQPLEASNQTHVQHGAPFLLGATNQVLACEGEQVRLAANFDSGVSPTLQWYRNGMPIAGATLAEIFVDSPHGGVSDVYVCEATNGCGTTVTDPILVTGSGQDADGVVDWQWIEESIEAFSIPFSNGYYCFGVRSERTAEQGGCNAGWLTRAGGGFNLALSNAIPLPSGVVEIWHRVTARFALTKETRLDFTGLGTSHLWCGANLPVVTLGAAEITGPVNVNFFQSITIGSGTALLPPGEYVLNASIHRRTAEGNKRLGRCGGTPCSCGPSCQSSCSCQVWDNCSFNLAVVFAPEPTCAADLNGDEFVNASDLPTLFNSWGAANGAAGDIDRDGVVGPADLSAILQSWGPCQ